MTLRRSKDQQYELSPERRLAAEARFHMTRNAKDALLVYLWRQSR